MLNMMRIGLVVAASALAAAPASALVVSGEVLSAPEGFGFQILGNAPAFFGAGQAESNNVEAWLEVDAGVASAALVPNAGGFIAAGDRRNSHMIRLDPAGFGLRTISGYVLFDRDIVNLFFGPVGFGASQADFGSPSTTYTFPAGSGIEIDAGDSATVDPSNRRRLNFTFNVGSGFDAVRVLTAAAPLPEVPVNPGVPEPATWAMLIAGFGLVGSAARRRRRVTAAG